VPSPLFEGVVESLARFAPRAITWRSRPASRRGLDRVLKANGWEDYFDITRAADETASKPHPLMLEQILAHCGAPEQALMVGDSSFDLQMARNAGMDSVAVSYGAQSIEALQQFEPGCRSIIFLNCTPGWSAGLIRFCWGRWHDRRMESTGQGECRER
jgi:phosphoglycolate phosphatase